MMIDLTSRASTHTRVHCCSFFENQNQKTQKRAAAFKLVSLEKKTVVFCAPPKVESEEKKTDTPGPFKRSLLFFVLCCLGFEKLSKFRVLKIQRKKGLSKRTVDLKRETLF